MKFVLENRWGLRHKKKVKYIGRLVINSGELCFCSIDNKLVIYFDNSMFKTQAKTPIIQNLSKIPDHLVWDGVNLNYTLSKKKGGYILKVFSKNLPKNGKNIEIDYNQILITDIEVNLLNRSISDQSTEK